MHLLIKTATLDFEQHAKPTSLVHPMEEDCKVSDLETGVPDQEADQQLFEEHNYHGKMSGVWLLIQLVPELENSGFSQDDYPFAGPRTQPTSKILVLPENGKAEPYKATVHILLIPVDCPGPIYEGSLHS